MAPIGVRSALVRPAVGSSSSRMPRLERQHHGEFQRLLLPCESRRAGVSSSAVEARRLEDVQGRVPAGASVGALRQTRGPARRGRRAMRRQSRDGQARRRRSPSGICARRRARRCVRRLRPDDRAPPIRDGRRRCAPAPSLMQRISVVLPAPLGPTRLTSSPARTSRSMPSSTCRLPIGLGDACMHGEPGRRPPAPRLGAVAQSSRRADLPPARRAGARAHEAATSGGEAARAAAMMTTTKTSADEELPQERQIAREVRR